MDWCGPNRLHYLPLNKSKGYQKQIPLKRDFYGTILSERFLLVYTPDFAKDRSAEIERRTGPDVRHPSDWVRSTHHRSFSGWALFA